MEQGECHGSALFRFMGTKSPLSGYHRAFKTGKETTNMRMNAVSMSAKPGSFAKTPAKRQVINNPVAGR